MKKWKTENCQFWISSKISFRDGGAGASEMEKWKWIPV